MSESRRGAAGGRRLGLVPVGRLDRLRPVVGPPPDVRLFCFPYAGGAPAAYGRWPARVPAGCEVWSFQYPGQGPRFDETPYTDWRRLVADACCAVERLGERPFAFFGHSMGGLVAFECARTLRRRGGPLPLHLMVSGCRAPGRNLLHGTRRISGLPRDAFVEEIRRMGGTPRNVIENPEFMDLLLPGLRSDFAMVEDYAFEEEPPLDLPLSVFVGSQDRMAPLDRCVGWRRQTLREFALDVIEGDHFFLHRAGDLARRVAERALEPARSWDEEAASLG